MQLADWASIAVIVLAIEAFVFALVFGALFLLLNIGVVKAQKAVRRYGPIVRNRLRQAAMATEQVSQTVARPVISIEVNNTRARQWLASLKNSTHRERSIQP
jgi:hypothetical protein